MQPVAVSNEPAAVSNNEPVDDASKPSSPVELRRVGPTLFTLAALATLVLLLVATPIPWLARRTVQSSVLVSLWSTHVVPGLVAVPETTTYVLDYPCSELRARFRAVEAFAVLAVILAGGATIAGIVARAANKSLKPGAALAGATAVSALIAWAMALRIFLQTAVCDGTASYAQRKYDLDAGFALFVAGSVVAAVAAVVAVRDPQVPSVLPDAVIDAVVSRVHAFLSFVAFVFMVVGAPTVLVKVWLTEGYLVQIVKGYEQKFVNGVKTYDVALWDLGCGELDKMAKVVLAFEIMAIAFTLGAFVVAVLAVRGKVGKALVLVSSALATLFVVVTVGAGLTLYYRRFCELPTLHYIGMRIAAGGALVISAMVISFFTTVVSVAVELVRLVTRPAAGGNNGPVAVLFAGAMLVALLFQSIAAGTPLFGISDPTSYTKYTFWQILVLTPAGGSTQPFGCSDISQRLVGGGALNVISIFFTLVAFVLGVLQFSSAALRRTASAVALFGAVALLVSWALAVTVFTSSFCGNAFYRSGYKIQYGLGLLLAAWCTTVTAAVVNYFVGPAQEASA